ncbi:kinase-like domain-containing protein [Glomus cerebriforme]|uniref:Kinase-like domain-containing protein n=1 Tax=Glomus cerebriforme TaxID=658196 RepID=A0A397T3T1_9GLOM|nr:kinase-like domain-containing protein [Glomus cerebriforme]
MSYKLFFEKLINFTSLTQPKQVKTKIKQSGNKIIDDFISYTCGRIEYIPYEKFENIEFIAKGGFSKIYKANWIDNPNEVVLKKLNNSKNITPKELNELKVFCDYHEKPIPRLSSNISNISKYFGITQDPNTQDFMIIMAYYNLGDLTNYINNNFYDMSWYSKLGHLRNIIDGLINIHYANIIHRDFHSGNIFFHIDLKDLNEYRLEKLGKPRIIIGDLGISKSATESTDDNNENYGIIPYMAPEIFQGKKYTKASDIYSFGMIMWEFMTGRRPFWDEIHDIELIIKISDGLRPPIVTNAPEGYIELMKECWFSNPEKRPTAADIKDKIEKLCTSESYDDWYSEKYTHITPSPDIGPVTINKRSAIYKSRPLSGMIKSAMSLRNSRSQTIDLETDPFYYYRKSNVESATKRKFEDNLIEENNDNYNGQCIKRKKLSENENAEPELDINTNYNHEYITKEIELDINAL